MPSKASLGLACVLALAVLGDLYAVSALPLEDLTTRDDSSRTGRPVGGFFPKKWPAAIALILYLITTVFHWIHFFRIGQRFMLTLTIGMSFMSLGFLIRIIYAGSPFSLGVYILMTFFILLSPCTFLATDYMLLHRLADSLGQRVSEECLIIRSSVLTKVFVWSDVITFFLQAGGGGLTASKDTSMQNIGTKITIIGLSLQLASFGLFTILLLVFALRVRSRFPEIWRVNHREQKNSSVFGLMKTTDVYNWKILHIIMCLTCVAILIRSGFRIAEYAGGYNGFLATHEGYFYLLDALPLWLGMTLYAFLWPTRVVNRSPDSAHDFRFVPTNGSDTAKLEYDDGRTGRRGPY